MKGLLISILIFFAFHPANAGTVADDFNSKQLDLNIWRQSASAGYRIDKGRLYLIPQDRDWETSMLISRQPFLLIREQDVKVSFDILLETIRTDENGDMSLIMGFTPNGEITSAEKAFNVVGLRVFLSAVRKISECSFRKKEMMGTNAKYRDNNLSNLKKLKDFGITGSNFSLKGELSVNAGVIKIKLSDPAFSAETETHLDEQFWKKGAYLFIQAANFRTGRGRVSIDNISIEYPGAYQTVSSGGKGKLSAFKPLDLRPFANMGFKDETADDKKGGWTDQGKNDLSYMPSGETVMQGIPFSIINPSENNGKSCIMLYSKNRDYFPKTTGPVSIDDFADSIIFLHSSAWAKRNEIAAHYSIHYENGCKTNLPVIVNEHIGDWWYGQLLSSSEASLFYRLKSDSSRSGAVFLYAWRWINPLPRKKIKSVTFFSGGGDTVVGIIAVTLVSDGVDEVARVNIENAFMTRIDDTRYSPPDKDKYPDRVICPAEKIINPNAVSTGDAGDSKGKAGILDQWKYIPDKYTEIVRSCGGITRFPHGGTIRIYFWPYTVKEWMPVLTAKGGRYGAIQDYIANHTDAAQYMRSYQEQLAFYKKHDLKLILLLNCHAIFNGKEFIYVKNLPEDEMKKKNPLIYGTFNIKALEQIVAANATLVDYVINGGFLDTVAYWELDNEPWTMKAEEYAYIAAAHIKMLKSKIPGAKIIVAAQGIKSYPPNLEGSSHYQWTKKVMLDLNKAGVAGYVDYFALHMYPFLSDSSEQWKNNLSEEWFIRDIYRNCDIISKLMDENGFGSVKIYASEIGVQSDEAIKGKSGNNDVLTGMRSALALAKAMMTFISHPRVDGITIHTFTHAGCVSRQENWPVSFSGCQTVFYQKEQKKIFTTPASDAIVLFNRFLKDSAKLIKYEQTALPGLQILAAEKNGIKRYFAVNSSSAAVKFPCAAVEKRVTLAADSLESTSLKYGSFLDQPQDLIKIEIKEGRDSLLPPFSINIIFL